MSAEVFVFPGRAGLPIPDAEGLGRVADTEHNRNGREDQGPPVGSVAWVCRPCDDFAFYVTPQGIRCYRCHAVQHF